VGLVRLSGFVRNAAFAFVLLLLAVAVDRLDAPATRPVRNYIVFVLSHDLDYRPWLEVVRGRLTWPPLFRQPGAGLDAGSVDPAAPEPGASGGR